MKTLIFNGSPRKSGDSMDIISRITSKISHDYKIVNAYYDNISACMDCRYCSTHYGCCINDDMQSVYKYLEECDNIIIVSPVYFSEVTGKLLDVMSRMQTYFCASFFRGEKNLIKPKLGAVILVGGGTGSLDKAYDTASMILKHINVKAVFPLVSSHNTDKQKAILDEKITNGIDDILKFLNKTPSDI